MKTHQKLGWSLIIVGILLCCAGYSFTPLALAGIASLIIGVALLTPLINWF